MNVWLIVLQGPGDTHITVIDEETWNWVTGAPGMPADVTGYSWTDSQVPASQLAKMDGRRVQLSIGSWQNDRMLAAVSADGFSPYDNLGDALRAVHAAGGVVVDVIEGDIYSW